MEAIQSLCLKFPQKHRVLMNFLSNILREEGGFEYKKAIVDSILCLIKVGLYTLSSVDPKLESAWFHSTLEPEM